MVAFPTLNYYLYVVEIYCGSEQEQGISLPYPRP